jgi:hypothetical protein
VETGPRPFGEIPPLWFKVFQIDEDFLSSELPRASGTNVLLSVLIMAVVASLAGAVGALLQDAVAPFAGLCGGLLGGFISFYLSAGIIYVGARIFGGKGTFGGQAYLQSLFFVPLGIVQWIVTVIPAVGPVLSVVVTIYNLVLSVRAVKVSHKLSTGKAVGAILAPLAVVIALAACVIAILLVLGPAVGEVFEEITNSI